MKAELSADGLNIGNLPIGARIGAHGIEAFAQFGDPCIPWLRIAG